MPIYILAIGRINAATVENASRSTLGLKRIRTSSRIRRPVLSGASLQGETQNYRGISMPCTSLHLKVTLFSPEFDFWATLIPSRSIKRRSAFIQHLKKHDINPESIDIDALAPALLPRLAPYQRKPSKGVEVEPTSPYVAQVATPPNIVFCEGTFYRQDERQDGPVLYPVPELPCVQNPMYAVGGSWHQGPIELPVLPEIGLYAINLPTPPPVLPTEGLLSFESPSPHHTGAAYMDSPISNPGLSYSASPSPSLPQQSLWNPGQDMRGYTTTSRSSTPSPTPSQIQPSSLLFLPHQTSYVAHSVEQKSTNEWDFEASIFAPSHEEFQGVRV
ncbi:hypothetical protein C0993_003025 [Termitomyces sp. T159_Od127]|nr:hypothetical protein C0993_003025 [Termitomyces sp. T159_Od127]